jgi:hypothetical protein
MQSGEIIKVVSKGILVVRSRDGFVCQLKLAEDITEADYAAFKDTSPLIPLACEVGLGPYDATENAFVRSSVRFAPLRENFKSRI